MEKLKDFFYDNKTVIIILLSLILILLTNALQYYYFKNNIKDEVPDEIILKEKEYEPEYIYVDIRGQVKKPGVYKISKDKRVIDAISISGGLTKDADTSVNNLSMRLNDEMVIIIYSKKEVENFTKTKEIEQLKEKNCNQKQNNIKNDSCVTEDKKETQTNTQKPKEETQTNTQKAKEEIQVPSIININTASLEELTTLKGIGEQKAQKIIEYRKKTPFNTKEQIMEVSGIGKSIYDKIKDNITT